MDFEDIETFEDYGFELAKILHESRNKKSTNLKNRRQSYVKFK